MKKILLFIFISLKGLSQPSIVINGYNNGDTINICPNQMVTLNATTNLINNNTNNYVISQIPYTPYDYSGTTTINSNGTPLIDDQISIAIPIGFPFCFFKNTYNRVFISSNGWIGFSLGQTVAFTSQTIPINSFVVPKNAIMGPWHDLNPGLALTGCSSNSIRNYVRYRSEGVAPFRRFIVSWVNVPMYQCTGICGTQQIVIYETTNIIENFIERKVVCNTWAGGTATQGLHNIDGTFAVVVPGRNSTVWTANNEGWRYTPNGVFTPNILWWVDGVIQWSGNSFSIINYPIGCYNITSVLYADCIPFNPSNSIYICVQPCCEIIYPTLYQN
jgi:hypothetical protein